jgi:hypothetical protein
LQLKDLRSNQDHIYDEIKALKQTALDSKKEMFDDITCKLDNLSKLVTSLKDNQPNQKQTSQTLPKKKKILFVGDSLSRKLNISVVKNVTDMDFKRVEAFIVSKDDPKAKIPSKNFTEIVPRELKKDNVSTLVLQGGTNEISNLNVSGNISEKMEAMKEEIRVSSLRLFNLAEESLKEHEGLEKVIILKRIFRCDTVQDDPSQIRAKLSEFGNRVLEDIWLTKGCPKNIVISHQPLECDGDLRISRYGFPSTKEYDGIHMRGKMAIQHYTGSVINVLLDNLTEFEATIKIPVSISQPTTYASVLKNDISSQQSKLNPKSRFNKSQFFQPPYSSAQPKFGHYSNRNAGPHFPTGGNHDVPSAWRNPATGTNETPSGEKYFYNVNTQNRFTSSVSGN